MIQNDFAGVALVYVYVVILLIVTEKLLARYPQASRKLLHILVGNVAFFLLVFQTRAVMAFIAAGPFILFTFLMSPYSPIKSIRGKTSSVGHGMGLVYYAITWTVLAYVFFDYKEVIAISIFAMSYGDGFASLFGMKYGKHKYRVFGDEKSYIGSAAMCIVTFIMIVIALLFYGINITHTILVYLVVIALVSAIVEGLTPKGLDNLSVPFVTSISYWMFMIA